MQIENIQGIECYEQDGTAYLKLDAVARGLGFTRIAASGNVVIRWERVDGYLEDLGVPTCGHDGFIPENIFYRLAMKAKNETAEKFQAKVADEIIPSIRKHGAYMTEDTLEKALTSPDFLIQLATKLKEEQEKSKALEEKVGNLEMSVHNMNEVIDKLEPKANYVDVILKSPSTVLTTQIAQDYGMSARKFNKTLSELRIQRKVGDQWILYADYLGEGYTHSRTIDIIRSNGQPDVKMQTEWTQKGRLFLYEELKKHDIYPTIERTMN